MMRPTRIGKAALAIFAAALHAAPALAQYGVQLAPYDLGVNGPQVSTFNSTDLFPWYLAAACAGFLIGYAFSEKFAGVRKAVWIVLGLALVAGSTIAPPPLRLLLGVPITICIFCIALGYGLARGALSKANPPPTTFGSAKWATAEHVRESGLADGKGLVLGAFPDAQQLLPLNYPGDRHLLTVAPTRAGKGVSAIIPNLLTYEGSAFVIDPKGENAMITAERRLRGLGQEVHILDPWGLTSKTTGIATSCFNPLDWIEPGPDMGERAMILADSLVMSPAGGGKDPFWDEEAKGLLMGLILHVATAGSEAKHRHLGRVRDLLMLPPAPFDELMGKMLASSNPIIAGTAARTLSKDEKLLSSVLSAAQSHTHIFDSPRLRESLSRSDFRFEDLKRGKVTVYLVLPADRLVTFGRWLRLLVQQAIAVTAQTIEEKPEKPILFLLDEMAALGRLSMVEHAYGLMAGFGMQLWGVVQDLSQLHAIYGEGWQTFIGNSGVLQYFGSRDQKTAEYFSALCGVATIKTVSKSIAQSLTGNGGSSSTNYGEASRKLALADELMRITSGTQLVLVENLDPIIARKLIWYQDERFASLGRNLHMPRQTPVQPEPA